MFRKRGGRKAQLTLFVILGLVILVVLAIIYFGIIRKAFIKEELRQEAVPEEFKPVKDYVELCIHKLGVEAVKKMGAHGGYINPADQNLTPYIIVFDPERPTESDWVSLTGDEDGMIPYYLHVPGKASYLNYEFGSVAPSIENMEYQLNVFISQNLPRCVNGFEALKEQGFDVSADNENITTGSVIHDDRIEFFVNYDVSVSKQGVRTRMNEFKSIIRFPFKKYYDLALNFMFAELVTSFLETFTKALISYHSGVDYTLLPPFMARTTLPYVVTWSNNKVKQDFQGLLLSYVPAMRVVGTKDYEPVTIQGGDVEAAFFNSMRLEVYNESLPNTAITLFYTGQPIDLRVQPSKGGIIKPSIEVTYANKFVPASQDNTYQFYYDVAYPVIIEIRGDEPSTEIPRYSFLFALEANLIENKPALYWNLGLGTADWDYSYLNITFDIPDNAISTPDGDVIPVKQRSITKSLFCDEDTWKTGEVRVRITDAITGVALRDARIGFGCGDYDECFVGSTDEKGEWKGKLPICQGGYLTLSKEGYGSKRVRLSTMEGKSVLIPTQKLYPLTRINAGVKKLEIQKMYVRNSSWGWEESPSALGLLQDIDNGSEQVVLIITQTGFEASTDPITYSIMFGREGVNEEEISLVPGEYEVTASLIDYKGVRIPANCSRVCSKKFLGFIKCTNYTYFPESEVVLEPALWGGVEIRSSTTGLFKVTASDLRNNKELEFRVLKLPDLEKSSPPGACIEALEEMGKVGEYSAKYKNEVMPVFK